MAQAMAVDDAAELVADWETADWTHEYEPADGHDPRAAHCNGGDETCATCAAAEEAATEARGLAAKAARHVAAGEWSAALTAAEEAEQLERQYGDAPRTRPLVAAVRAAIDAAHNAAALQSVYVTARDGWSVVSDGVDVWLTGDRLRVPPARNDQESSARALALDGGEATADAYDDLVSAVEVAASRDGGQCDGEQVAAAIKAGAVDEDEARRWWGYVPQATEVR